jgi:ABC-type methionine transport system permease subunit
VLLTHRLHVAVVTLLPQVLSMMRAAAQAQRLLPLLLLLLLLVPMPAICLQAQIGLTGQIVSADLTPLAAAMQAAA